MRTTAANFTKRPANVTKKEVSSVLETLGIILSAILTALFIAVKLILGADTAHN
jgi:hypothetical protein